MTWFRENYEGSCAIEVKATDGNSIPASALQSHQLAALRQVKSSSLVYKIPDMGYAKKPFDAFKLGGVQGFVVACFSSHGLCYVIPVEEWSGGRYDMGGGWQVIRL